MSTQAELFLQVLDYIRPEGYYARTLKEKEIMSALEKKKLVKRKPGTKRVYILTSDFTKASNMDKATFKQLLKNYFSEMKTSQQPFVSISDLRNQFTAQGVDSELFDRLLIELYDNTEIELEKSFTAQEGEVKGLNYKNRKYFSYILSVS